MLRGVSRHFPGAEGGPGSAWDPVAPHHPQPSLHRHPPRGGQEQVRVTLETLALQSLPRRRPPAPLTCSERGVYMAPGQHPPGHPNKRVPHFLRTGTTLHSLNPQAVATLLRVRGPPFTCSEWPFSKQQAWGRAGDLTAVTCSWDTVCPQPWASGGRRGFLEVRPLVLLSH